jgi:hypothetical protein
MYPPYSCGEIRGIQANGKHPERLFVVYHIRSMIAVRMSRFCENMENCGPGLRTAVFA